MNKKSQLGRNVILYIIISLVIIVVVELSKPDASAPLFPNKSGIINARITKVKAAIPRRTKALIAIIDLLFFIFINFILLIY